MLKDEVVRDVVDDDGSLQVSPEQAQVLDQERTVLGGMLAVESVLDELLWIDLVDNLISVLLESGCEDDDFVVFCHQLYELHAPRSHEKVTFLPIVNVVDEGLVEVKHESVRGKLLLFWEWHQEWWNSLGQVLEVVRELCLLRSCNRRSLQDSERVLACESLTPTATDEIAGS